MIKLNEIGNNPLPWKLKAATDEDVYYQFKTKKYTYAVGFSKTEDDPTFESYDLLFTPVESKGLDTKEGVMVKIMATVADITKNFINKYQPDEITIHPITRGSEDDPKRSRIYGYYLERNLPQNYSLLKTGDSFRLIKK
jgi:hypothetical protein